MIIRDFTTPYTFLEAWTYDRLFGTATREFLLGPELRQEIDALAPGIRVLDVGCGGGYAAIAIAERRPDLRVTGLDLNPGQIARAKRRAAKQGVQAEFVEGSALDMPFADGAFDLVVSVGSIKHWPDQAAGFGECARVLSPGGELIIVEADRGCHLDDARRFLRASNVPRIFEPLTLAMFRTWVAGQGIDADDARSLLAGTSLVDGTVERSPGLPGIAIRARVASA